MVKTIAAGMTWQWVTHGSEAYWQTVALRDAVLRRPLALSFSGDELAAESGQLHLAGFWAGEMLACAVLEWTDPTVAKMRQVAIHPDRQGQGIGHQLVRVFEHKARQSNARAILLHARQTAVGFYLKLGYQFVGVSFVEIGIPHQKMVKRLDVHPDGRS